MSMLRREFGVGEPVRRGMEVQIAREGEWRPAVLGFRGEGVHEQILKGRDASIDWEDVFVGEFCSFFFFLFPFFCPLFFFFLCGKQRGVPFCFCVDADYWRLYRQRDTDCARLPLGDGEQTPDELVDVAFVIATTRATL
jgi:hypothetical protein